MESAAGEAYSAAWGRIFRLGKIGLNIVCNVFLWLLGLAPSNLGLQELNNQLRYGQYHLPMGVDGLASLA